MVYSIFDTIGIQSYIFQGKELQPMLGASLLVDALLSDWLRTIATNDKHGTEIYSGGGNAVWKFYSMDDAKAVSWELSKKALCEAPGLRFAVYHLEESEEKPVTKAALLEGVSRVKQLAPFSWADIPTPFSRTDPDTGYPMTEGETIALAQRAKKSFRENNKLDIQKLTLQDGYTTFASSFSDMGQPEGENHIAIVHIDGNGLGSSLANEPLEKMPEISKEIDTVFHDALTGTITQILEVITADKERGQERRMKDTGPVFPFRSLIRKGDDITFVCAGILGIQAAGFFLDALKEKKINGQPVTACAGIAIVPTSSRIDNAYTLAESLCANAKAKRANNSNEDSWLDWEVSLDDVSTPLSEIRRMRYAARFNAAPGSLTCRPWHFPSFKEKIIGNIALMKKKERSRVKAVYGAFFLGEESLQDEMAHHRSRDTAFLPPIDMSGVPGFAANSGYNMETPFINTTNGATPYPDLLGILEYWLGDK